MTVRRSQRPLPYLHLNRDPRGRVFSIIHSICSADEDGQQQEMRTGPSILPLSTGENNTLGGFEASLLPHHSAMAARFRERLPPVKR